MVVKPGVLAIPPPSISLPLAWLSLHAPLDPLGPAVQNVLLCAGGGEGTAIGIGNGDSYLVSVSNADSNWDSVIGTAASDHSSMA